MEPIGGNGMDKRPSLTKLTRLPALLVAAAMLAGLPFPALSLPADPTDQMPPPSTPPKEAPKEAPRVPSTPPKAAVQPPAPPPPPPPPPRVAAPPVTQPPPGQLPCNWSGDSGGQGVTRNRHYLGERPGFVSINYNLYVKPDAIKVMYRGRELAGTGGPRSGRGGFGFDWKPVAPDYSVDVIVTGEMQGTQWTYNLACPK
jgi:hypothetical protein